MSSFSPNIAMSDIPEPEIAWHARTTVDTIPVMQSCPKIVALLNLFEQADAWSTEDVVLLPPREIPAPYHDLLVHTSDMTSTLTGYHGEEIRLHVLDALPGPDSLARHVILEGSRSGRPVEYGAIEINLKVLDPTIRDKVRSGKVPLGGILNSKHFCYKSCPGAFFRIRPNRRIADKLKVAPDQWLYGRCNCLSDNGGRTIAEVVEIVPPEPVEGEETN